MKRSILVALSLTSTCAAAWADDRRFAVGVGVGTGGLEAHAAVRLIDEVVVRGTGTFLNFDQDGNYDGIDYSGEIDFSAFGAFADLHPFGDGFTVTAGAYFGKRQIKLTATPTGIEDIGGTLYTAAEIGTLSGDLDLGDFAPYVGIGYDSTFSSQGRLGFRFAAGVAFGDPSVNLTATGTAAVTPGFQADLQQEEDALQDDVEYAKYYPVVSLGLTYRLN